MVSCTDVLSWQEDVDAKTDTALKRWYDIVVQFPAVSDTVRQLGLIDNLAEQLKMLRDVMAGKSPLTLIKRANSLLRYVEFLRENGVKVPGSEPWFYKFICDQRADGAPASRLQSTIESIRFTEHTFGIASLCDNLLSKRCLGAARLVQSGEKRQASPLTVDNSSNCIDTLG